MDSGQPSHGLWRKVGIVLGSVRALDSIGIGVFLTVLFWVSFELIGVAVLIFAVYALNLAASVLWLYAIFKKKSRLLLVSLIWWVIPLLISLILIISVLSAESPNNTTTEHYEQKGIARCFNDWLKVLVIIGGVLSLLFYAIALKSFAKMKEAFDGDASEIQGLGVGYTPKNKTTDLNIY